ncbi:hypothetical protein BDF22DRAFT_691496 [Syncephalis plumigaleata]|nr:hypothetical protein BDF22DRAFT_691496 [Syncephalis plumigaleata]
MASGVAPSMGDKPATEPAVPSLPGSSASTRNPAGPPTGNAPPTPSLIDAAVPPPETQPGYKPAPGMMQEQPAAAYGANSPGNDAGAVASSSGGKPAGKQADATISFNVDESMLTPPKNAAGPSQGATGPNGAVIPSQDAIAPNNAAIPPTAGPNGATGPSQGTNTPNGAVVPPTAGPSGAAPPSYGATAPTDATDSSYGDTNSPTAGPTGATAPSKGATAPSKGAAAPTDTKTPPINIDDDTMYDTGVTAPAANKTSPGSVAPSADDKTPKSTAPSADDKASEPSPKSSSKSTSQVPEGEYLDINEPILKSPSKHKKKGGKYAACKELHGKERKECRKHTREAIKEAKKKSKEEEKSEPKEEYSAYGAAAY